MVSSKMSALVTVLLVILVATQVAEGQQSGTPSCASKLVPCANYLNSTKPPPSCCDPLKEAVTKELPCLCSLYANPSFLAGLGINITQALGLPRYCGISGDLSACNKAQAPSGSSSSEPPPAVPGGNNGNGVGKIAGSGLSSILLILASLILC